MKRRSFTGPLLLLLVGILLLWHNLHPEAPLFDTLARYWPFLLIGWGLLRIAEVLIWRNQNWAGFSGGEIFLVILICILGSAAWQARQNGFRISLGGPSLWQDSFDFPVTAQHSTTGMSRITIENLRGNVKVVGSDVYQVSVAGRKSIRAWNRADAERVNGDTPVEIVAQGDRLLIRTNQERSSESNQVETDLEMTVPRSFIVEAHGRNSDFEVDDINGDVELKSDRAEVRLARLSGNVRLDLGRSNLVRASEVKGGMELRAGRGNDVDLEDIGGQVIISGTFSGNLEFKNLAKPLQYDGARNTELRAEAIPGRLSMTLGEVTGSGITGPVKLVARSRDIRLDDFTRSLDVETENGDVELKPALPMPAIEARAGQGRIELIVPDKAGFDLEATAEHGEVTNDYGPQIEQVADGRAVTLKGKVGSGPKVRLNSRRGSVSIRKEGDVPSTIPAPVKSERMPTLPKSLKAVEVRM